MTPRRRLLCTAVPALLVAVLPGLSKKREAVAAEQS